MVVAAFCCAAQRGGNALVHSGPANSLLDESVLRRIWCGVKAKVIVMPKAAVLDPQGNAVRDAMRHLGMPEVRNVRIGKYMEIEIDGKNGDLESRLHGLCRDLLSNPVIEDYELQKVDPEGQRKTPDAQCSTLNAQVHKRKTRKQR